MPYESFSFFEYATIASLTNLFNDVLFLSAYVAYSICKVGLILTLKDPLNDFSGDIQP